MYRQYKDKVYLAAAERQAKLACVRFLDDTSPLPKAFDTSRKTAAGREFGSFYFRGATRMHALALLGEARREAGGK